MTKRIWCRRSPRCDVCFLECSDNLLMTLWLSIFVCIVDYPFSLYQAQPSSGNDKETPPFFSRHYLLKTRPTRCIFKWRSILPSVAISFCYLFSFWAATLYRTAPFRLESNIFCCNTAVVNSSLSSVAHSEPTSTPLSLLELPLTTVLATTLSSLRKPSFTLLPAPRQYSSSTSSFIGCIYSAPVSSLLPL